MLYFSQSMRAFTLLELLVTLFILGILITAAVPASQHFLEKNNSNAEVNALIQGLAYARNEAIILSEKVIFCSSSNGQSCGGSWQDGQLAIKADGEVLRVFPALTKANLVWNSSAGKDDRLEWMPTGYTNGQRGTFYYCASDVDASQSIVIINTGRWYVTAMNSADFLAHCS